MPSTVVMPTTSGSRVARPRKNSSERMSSTGNASASERPRSPETLSPTWASANTAPPSCTSGASPATDSTASSTAPSSAPARSVAARKVERPSRETKPGAPVLSAVATVAMPGTRSRRARSWATRARAAGASAPRGGRDEQDHARGGLDARGLLHAHDGARGARVGGGEAARVLELAGHGTTQDARDQDEGEEEEEGPPGVGGA